MKYSVYPGAELGDYITNKRLLGSKLLDIYINFYRSLLFLLHPQPPTPSLFVCETEFSYNFLKFPWLVSHCII